MVGIIVTYFLQNQRNFNDVFIIGSLVVLSFWIIEAIVIIFNPTIVVTESYFNCLLLYCDKGFIKSNSKNILRSQTTFMEHYNRKDIIKIVEIITNYIKISKNKDKLYENNN